MSDNDTHHHSEGFLLFGAVAIALTIRKSLQDMAVVQTLGAFTNMRQTEHKPHLRFVDIQCIQ